VTGSATFDGPVGFVGLGTMGLPMACNLLRKGTSLVVHDLSRGAVEAAVAAGARPASSVAQLAHEADVVITMLPSEAAVRSVALGADGLIRAMRPGGVHVDMSTVEPHTSREIAAALAASGIFMLDAPVSRGHEAAIAGTLSVMAGGERAVFDRVLPLLFAMGTDVFHCGPAGTGSLFKVVNNAIVATTACAVAEALVVGVKAGADLGALLPVLRASSSNSFVLEKFFERKALRGDFEPGGSIDIVAKDLELALGVASEHRVAAPMAGLGYQLYAILRGQGHGGRDFASVITLAEDAAGVRARLG
jgi:4-hydroxybutyrate dehydrogenase/sulfolactaldehyde 3-reductase